MKTKTTHVGGNHMSAPKRVVPWNAGTSGLDRQAWISLALHHREWETQSTARASQSWNVS